MTRIFKFACLFVLLLPAVIAAPIPDALLPYEPIDISSGYGVGSGVVSTGHVVYGFNGMEGQILNIQVIVTRILQGTQYTDDDSMLWVFDDSGTLLAENDDFDDLQSRIPRFRVPATGLYLVGVTTCCESDPVYTGGVLTGWQDAGESNIEFDLRVSSVPEPSSFALIGLGAVALGIVRRFRR